MWGCLEGEEHREAGESVVKSNTFFKVEKKKKQQENALASGKALSAKHSSGLRSYPPNSFNCPDDLSYNRKLFFSLFRISILLLKNSLKLQTSLLNTYSVELFSHHWKSEEH